LVMLISAVLLGFVGLAFVVQGIAAAIN